MQRLVSAYLAPGLSADHLRTQPGNCGMEALETGQEWMSSSAEGDSVALQTQNLAHSLTWPVKNSVILSHQLSFAL